MQCLVVAIGDSVDSAFGNNISIDAIVVMGSFMTVSWLLSCMAKIGAYVYRLWQNRVWTCVAVSGIVSVVCGLAAVIMRDQIAHIFTLTDIQYEMLGNTIAVYGICLPIVGMGEVFDMFCLMKGKMKYLVIADIVFYILLIGLDVVVVVLKLECMWLVVGTMFSFLVFDIILLLSTGVLKQREKVQLKDCFACVKHGLNFLMSKISIRIAIIVMRSTVSELGTAPYALYTVANAVEEFNENYIGAWENFLTVKIKQYSPRRRFAATLSFFKRYWKLFLCLICFSIPITTLVLKGSLGYFDVISCAYIVCLGNVFAVFERMFYAYLSTYEKSSILRWDGIIGASVRIGCCFIVYAAGGSLMGYLFCYPIDVLCRALYTYCMSRKTAKEHKLCT